MNADTYNRRTGRARSLYSRRKHMRREGKQEANRRSRREARQSLDRQLAEHLRDTLTI